MPRPTLEALAADVARLLVAGGGSIPGDEGLRHREKTLRDLGKKVPALAKLAEIVAQAASAEAGKAPRALLDLLTAVGQVRAGLTTSGVEGPIEPAEPSGPWATPLPLRDLHPLAAALARLGSGRMEVLNEAIGNGSLGDLRLFDVLLGGLDDSRSEYADRVAAEALPAFGPAALPDLRSGLDLLAKEADPRRMTAIASIAPDEAIALGRQAISEGSTAWKVLGLETMAKLAPEEAADLALTLLALLKAPDEPSKARGKKGKPRPKLEPEIRDAAMACLGGSRRDEALELLMISLFEEEKGGLYGHAVSHDGLPRSPHPKASERLLGEFDRIIAQSLAVRQELPRDEAQAEAAIEAAENGLWCLTMILGDRRDPRAAPPLIGLLSHPAPHFRKLAVKSLAALGDPAGMEAAAATIDDPELWEEAVEAAWLLPPAPRFEHLSPLLRSLSGRDEEARAKGHHLLQKFRSEESEPDRRTDWDPRWADALRPHLGGPEGQKVALALSVVLGAGAIPDLLVALGRPDDSWNTKSRVIEVLRRLRAREAVVPLIRMITMDSANRGIYRLVLDALRDLGDASAIPLLTQRAGRLPSAWMKDDVEALIAHLSKVPPS